MAVLHKNCVPLMQEPTNTRDAATRAPVLRKNSIQGSCAGWALRLWDDPGVLKAIAIILSLMSDLISCFGLVLRPASPWRQRSCSCVGNWRCMWREE
jgi:hypothetical protein